jgi:cation transport regulator ChaB
MISIDNTNRINARTISNEILKVQRKYEAMAMEEYKDLRDRRDTLYKEENEFRAKASEFLKQLKPGDKVSVQTQVGPDGGTIIQDYNNAVIEHIHIIGSKVNTFNVSDPAIYDGKPFTIGLGCLLSIKLR